MTEPGWIFSTATGIRVSLLVQPRASRSEIVGVQGGALHIRLAAPPVDGAANEALIRLVSEELGVRRAAVAIVSGQRGRRKVVAVEGMTPAKMKELLGLEK